MFWTFKTVITDSTIFKILLFRLNFDTVLIKSYVNLWVKPYHTYVIWTSKTFSLSPMIEVTYQKLMFTYDQ